MRRVLSGLLLLALAACAPLPDSGQRKLTAQGIRPGTTAAVRKAADRLGYSHRDIVSGAGHDACWINRVAPTAMIFCPCKDGLSHNEAEEITSQWAEMGVNVLFHAVVETAGIVE